jgi:hypothetical protein
LYTIAFVEGSWKVALAGGIEALAQDVVVKDLEMIGRKSRRRSFLAVESLEVVVVGYLRESFE